MTESSDFISFYDNPSIDGVAGAPDEGSYIVRIGVLFGAGKLTAGQARALLAQRGIGGVTLLEGLPDDYRPGRRRQADASAVVATPNPV